MSYKFVYRVQNKKKYIGNNIGNIVCRSTWEVGLAKWCDKNLKVQRWAMESVVVPYYDTVTFKTRRYYIDFYLEMESGEKYLIEVKPQCQTVPPKDYAQRLSKVRAILNESMDIAKNEKFQKKFFPVLAYAKNYDKWTTAKRFADKKGFIFQVWTEKSLKSLGIKII